MMMRKFRNLSVLHVFVLVALVIGLPLCAAESWPRSGEGLEPDANLSGGRLENGMRYLILTNDEPPQRLSLRLYVGTGSLMEADDEQGLAHFLEHMAFNGTENFAPGEMVEFFQRIGMAFGADTNAHTGFDETVYKIDLPDLQEETIEQSLLLLRDYADRMLLLDAEIERERGVILAEKRARDSVGYRTFVAYWTFLFPDSIIPERFPIGIEEVIRTAGRETFERFYHTWYRPDNIVLVAVGDVDPAMLAGRIEEMFGSMRKPSAPLPEIDLGKVDPQGVTALLHTEVDAPATQISIFGLRPYTKGPDSRLRRQSDIAVATANRILSRRLNRLAEQEDIPFSEGAAFSTDYLQFFELSGVEVTCRPEEWASALAILENELRRALQWGVTEAEFAEVRASIINDQRQALRSAPSRRSRALADNLVRSIGREFVFTHPETELEIVEELFAQLDVEDVNRALRAAWDVPGIKIFVSGNLELDDADSVILEHFLAAGEIEVEPIEEGDLAAFGYADFGAAGEIVSRVDHSEPNIVQLRFANNVAANLMRTTYEQGVIRVLVRFGGGKLAETENNQGVAMMAAHTYVEGGTGMHSFDELRRILAGHTVGVDFTVEEGSFTLSGVTNPDDLKLQLQLLAAYVLDPGFRPEAMVMARRDLPQIYIQAGSTVEGVLRNEVVRALAGGSYRFGLPPRERVEAITLEEVAAWLAPANQQDFLELSIVGDFEEESLVDALAATFGALPERDAEPRPWTAERRIQKAAVPDQLAFGFRSTVDRAAAIVYWPTTDWWDISLTRRLNLLASVFSDRLRIEIRQQHGDAYSPFAVSDSSEVFTDYGWLFGGAIVDPAVAERVVDAVRSIGQRLATEGVSEDELVRARTPLISRIREMRRNNSYWLNRVLADSQRHPQKIEWANQLIADVESVTAAELSQLAAEYLGEERALGVTISPQEISE